MFRIRCLVTGHNHLIGIESLRDLRSTTKGPVAVVECACRSLVVLEAGVQTGHQPDVRTEIVA